MLSERQNRSLEGCGMARWVGGYSDPARRSLALSYILPSRACQPEMCRKRVPAAARARVGDAWGGRSDANSVNLHGSALLWAASGAQLGALV